MTFQKPRCAGSVSLRDLGTAELVVVTTSRLWVAAVCGPFRPNAVNWYDGLAAAGVAEQPAMAFHELMETIVTGVDGPLDFRPPHCRHLGQDEGRVLHLLSLLQHNRKYETAHLLSGWMPAASRRVAGRLAICLAEGLLQAGLVLPSSGERSADETSASSAHQHARRSALH
jgi:hypothetical protein